MINWDRVRELKDDIGADEIGDVVELFLEEVEEVIDRLKQPDRPRELESDMHFLKGSALNLGFETLGTMCSDAEKSAAKGSDADVPVAAILDLFEASKVAFLTGLNRA